MPRAKIDHLVVAALDLAEGVEYVRQTLGVSPGGGGQHLAQGTHNKVLRLGRDCYLEVIAIDPDGTAPQRPRWFELDTEFMQQRLRERPRLITWAVGTERIEVLAARCAEPLGEILPMQRGDLRWRLTLPPDGHLPGGGLIPFLIQWADSPHPASLMPETGCRLAGLQGWHPQPEAILHAIRSLGMESAFQVLPAPPGKSPSLAAQIRTPDGLKRLL